MLGIKVTIVRYLSDEPQPGIVECKLEDAHGRQWSFVEKTAIVSAEHLDAHTSYPQRGVIAAEIVGRSVDATGREFICVDTERPWHVESVDGVTQFDVGGVAGGLVTASTGEKSRYTQNLRRSRKDGVSLRLRQSART